jgi:predicted nucleotidyltransferase
LQSVELDKVRTLLTPTLRRLGVHKAVVFGSLSKGAGSRKSDVDLLIVVETEERFFKRYDRFDEIYAKLKGRSVDLLIYTPEELGKIKHRPFIKKILAEGQIISYYSALYWVSQL